MGVVALDHLRQRRLGVPRLEAGVEELVVVEDMDDGGKLGRRAALRLELQEVLGARRAPPFGFGDVAVDHGRAFGPPGGDGELALAGRRLRWPRRGHRQQEGKHCREPQLPAAASHRRMIGQGSPAVNPRTAARSPAERLTKRWSTLGAPGRSRWSRSAVALVFVQRVLLDRGGLRAPRPDVLPRSAAGPLYRLPSFRLRRPPCRSPPPPAHRLLTDSKP